MLRLSITQAADRLKKSRQWIYILVISGRIKAERVGNSFIIEEKALEDYLNSKQNNNLIQTTISNPK